MKRTWRYGWISEIDDNWGEDFGDRSEYILIDGWLIIGLVIAHTRRESKHGREIQEQNLGSGKVCMQMGNLPLPFLITGR